MGKRDRLKAAKLEGSSSGDDKRKRKSPIEADEDLSFKSVQKSVKTDPRDDGAGEIGSNLKEERSKREKKRMRKSTEVEGCGDAGTNEIDAGFREFCGGLFLGDDVKENEKSVNGNTASVASETVEDNAAEVANKVAEDSATGLSSKAVEDSVAMVANTAAESNPVAVSDNAVLRKLLRGPRYFDPPDSSWGACYNCGEEGHTSANCTSARRKKPCFVCGSFEHNAKQCSKGRDCFLCKQQGHRAKDCPERNKSSKLCLKCGDLGHEMFSCRNDYCPDDLKEIQCYICGVNGHLCCKDYGDPGPREVSCYRCGLSGHTGLACSGSRWDTSDRSRRDANDRSRWNTNDMAPPSSCYKCGTVGHFARECNSSIKASKRNREQSTPKHKSPKKKRDHLGTRSAPYDIKARKKKNSKSIQFSSPAKTKHRRGWTTEHPGDHFSSKSKHSYSSKSPATPRDRYARIPYSYGDHASSSRSPRHPQKISFYGSPSNGSARSHQHRHSASRRSVGRNNDWW